MMKEGIDMDWILYNGDLIKEDELKLSREDRAYQFGDGIYEVIRIYGGDFFTAEEHIDRFYESAEKIRMVFPYTKDVFHKMLHELVELNEVTDGQVYVQVSRGASMRQHHFPELAEPVLVASTKPLSRPIEWMKAGVKAKLIEDVRWLRCDIKSLNLLGNVLAKQEAHEAGCFEAILHRGDVVTEGSSSNMFGIKEGILYTHPATNLILNGITRRVIMQICKDLDIELQEMAFTVDQALAMDEFFMCSTTAEILPVIQIDDKVIGDGEPGKVTNRLIEAFEARIGVSVKA